MIADKSPAVLETEAGNPSFYSLNHRLNRRTTKVSREHHLDEWEGQSADYLRYQECVHRLD